MVKKDVIDFENFAKYQIFKIIYVDGDIRERNHFQVTGKYRAHDGRNIKAKLNHKIFVALNKLKSFDSHLIMQELGKFNFKKTSYQLYQ